MAKVPTVKVPVTVDASGVEGQLRKTERKMRESAQRVSKIRAAATPAVGALGGGALGGIAGGLGQFGMAGGAIGMGAMAAAAPLLLANRVLSAFAEATRGSTEALAKFRETGINATGLNSTVLEILSQFEAKAQALATGPTLFQSFLAGADSEANAVLDFFASMKEGAAGLSAALGALTSGKSLAEAFLAMQLPSAGESRGEQLKAEMDAIATTSQQRNLNLIEYGGIATANPLVTLFAQLTRALT